MENPASESTLKPAKKRSDKTKAREAAYKKAQREGPNREKYLAQKRASYERTKEHVLAYQKKFKEENKDVVYEWGKKYRENKKDELKKQKAADYQKNKERYKKSQNEWRKNNPNWGREWREKNIAHVRERSRVYQKNRRATDPWYSAAANQRSRLSTLLKAIGVAKDFSLNLRQRQLKEWLEPKFLPGMTWQNYGTAWHVDHIVPCSSWNLTKTEEIKKCFHYHNLQPLWAADNIEKSDKVMKQSELPIPA